MPLAFDPNQTIDFVLLTDQDKPEHERPTFVFRFVTSREWLQMAKLFQQADKAQDEAEHLTLCYDALRIPLVGWRHLPLPYDPADLDGVTSPVDINDFRANLLDQLTLAEIDKKKFARQSQSKPANSAQSVNGASPTSGTAPASN